MLKHYIEKFRFMKFLGVLRKQMSLSSFTREFQIGQRRMIRFLMHLRLKFKNEFSKMKLKLENLVEIWWPIRN